MRSIIILIIITSLINCKPVNKKNAQSLNKEAEIRIDTILINNEKFLKTSKLPNKRFKGLTNLKGDTIVPFEDFYSRLDLLDINLDSYEDLRIYIRSNTPNNCDNYLFNTKDKTYRKIDNCDWDITPIKETNYFYSYARVGCADFNWESYLSKIENYKLIKLGLIDGRGCGSDEEKSLEKPQIKIYKINSRTEEQRLIEVLPYKDYIPKFEEKWTFIEKYWYQNNEKFTN